MIKESVCIRKHLCARSHVRMDLSPSLRGSIRMDSGRRSLSHSCFDLEKHGFFAAGCLPDGVCLTLISMLTVPESNCFSP